MLGPFNYFMMLDPKGENPPKPSGVTSWTEEFCSIPFFGLKF
jgi:hypothetical protein